MSDTGEGKPQQPQAPRGSHLPPPSLRTSQQSSERVKLRRALGSLGMTLIAPGSVQLAAGNKRLGRIALRLWAVLWALLLLLGICALVWRAGVISMFTNSAVLLSLQVLLVILGIGWGLLFIDAWRLARPPELARRHRLGFAALTGVLVFVVVGGLVSSASIVGSQRSLMAAVFTGGGETQAQDGRYNILLLGGDAGKGRTGLRPDSLTVASVDAQTGRTVLVGLPRNMEDVPFPASSPMHKKFPKGFGCPDHSCMLNAIYTYATGHPGLYPKSVRDPGVQATKEAVEGATGLKINYYAMIDLKGFESLINAVGGVRIDVNRDIPIGGGEAKLYGYVKKGKNQLLDGRSALWFARSRSDSSDYDRMARQKCVMTAMLKQLDPVTVLTNFNAIAKAGKQIVETDIPPNKVDTMVNLALKAKEKPIASVSFVPPAIYPGNPNIAKMHTMVAKKITQSEAKDHPTTAKATPAAQPTTASSASPSASASKKPKKAATLKPGQQTDDLASVCSAS